MPTGTGYAAHAGSSTPSHHSAQARNGAVVLDDRNAALELTGSGNSVVLVVGPRDEAVRNPGPGRLAILVADGGEFAAVAAAMDRELFDLPSASPPGPAPA